MQNIDEKNSRCRFFSACGGCAYLDLNEEEYQKIKITNLKKDIAEISNLVPGLDNIGSKAGEGLEFFSVGPHSRRKIILQVDEKNHLGFFAKTSKNLVQIDACYVAEKRISDLIPLLQNIFNNFEANVVLQIIITAFDNIIDVVFSCKRELNFSQIKKITEFSKVNKINVSYRIRNNLTPILILQPNQIYYPNFKIDLGPEIFIQATKSGSDKIISFIKNFIENNFTKKINIADIYAGFGSYSFAVSDLAKEVHAFEGSEEMIALINKNAAKNSLSNKIKAVLCDLMVHPLGEKDLQKFDLAIINPPRNGAGPQIHKIAKSSIKSLVYVSCNPKTFARDAKTLLDSGFKINNLIIIDQFYASQHLELVAVFVN